MFECLNIKLNILDSDFRIYKTYELRDGLENTKKNKTGGNFTDEDILNLNNLNVQNVEFEDEFISNNVQEIKHVENYKNNIEVIDMKIFPHDTLNILKQKLVSVLDIEDQFITITNINSYKIFIDDIEYKNNDIKNKLFDIIPIDDILYKKRSLVSTESYDNRILISDTLEDYDTFNVLTLSEFITDKALILENIKKDLEILEVIYHSFLQKYFINLTKDNFMRWLSNDYNYTTPSVNYIYRETAINEYNLLKSLTNDTDKYMQNYTYLEFETYLDVELNILHLFNSTEISTIKNLKYVKFRHNNNLLMKYNKYIPFLDLENLIHVKNIEINNTLIFIFADFSISFYQDKYECAINKDVNMENLLDFINVNINPVLKKLQINKIKNTNLLIFKKFNMQYVYKNNITSKNFNSLVKSLNILIISGIIQEFDDNLEVGRKSYNLIKFIADEIDQLRFYPYSKEIVNRKIIFSYKQEKLYIDIKNINRREYFSITNFLNKFLFYNESKFLKNKNIDYKKLSLKNIDPITFDKKYSRLCQKRYQPIVIKDPQNYDKSRFVKYKNNYTNDQEYYYCPNNKYPYIKFLKSTDNNYCLPCCKKMNLSNANYKNMHDSCLNNGTYKNDKDEIDENLKELHDVNTMSISSIYVLKKDTTNNENRVVKLPDQLNFLNNGSELYMISRKKKFNSFNISILFILSYILKKSVNDINYNINSFLRKNNYIFFLLLDGEMNKYFSDLESFLNALIQIFSYKEFYMLNIDLNKIYIELAYYIYDIKFITISTTQSQNKGEEDILELESFETSDKMVILIKNGDNYNFISSENTSIFGPSDKTIQLLENVVNVEIKTLKKSEIEFVDFNSLKKYAEDKNIKMTHYLNKKFLCEAVIIKNIYFPIKNRYIKNVEKLDIKTNLFIKGENFKFSHLDKIIDFIIDYNNEIYKNKNSADDKQLEVIFMKQLNKYISTDKNILQIPDSPHLGNYIRINKLIEVDGNITSICINNKISYCHPIKKSDAEKLVSKIKKSIEENIKVAEKVLTRPINITDGDLFLKNLYDPLELNKVLYSEPKSYKKEEFINNLYHKNIYKLFIYQLNDNLLGINSKVASLSDLTENIILKNKDKLFDTVNDLNIDNETVYNKDIFYNKKRLIINSELLNEMITLFIEDLQNPFRKDYITNYKYYTSFNNQNNYNSFTNEIIIIN